jgi:hypothetical protein
MAVITVENLAGVQNFAVELGRAFADQRQSHMRERR